MPPEASTVAPPFFCLDAVVVVVAVPPEFELPLMGREKKFCFYTWCYCPPPLVMVDSFEGVRLMLLLCLDDG